MHRNDSAAVCREGANPLTQSGEKGTEKDHHACEGPRAAKKKKKIKAIPETGEAAPLNTALLPHLL